MQTNQLESSIEMCQQEWFGYKIDELAVAVYVKQLQSSKLCYKLRVSCLSNFENTFCILYYMSNVSKLVDKFQSS